MPWPWHPRVRYQAGDLLAIHGPEGFDLVFSSTTLHHLPDLEAALGHLRRLVAPGGLVVLVDNVAPRPTPPRWVTGSERSGTSPETCDATASRRRGGC